MAFHAESDRRIRDHYECVFHLLHILHILPFVYRFNERRRLRCVARPIWLAQATRFSSERSVSATARERL